MQVGDEIHAVVEHLTRSGEQLARSGEELAATHTAADSRMDLALPGWQGLSAAALTVRSEAWRASTTTLLTRLGTHVETLHRCAESFSNMERDNTAAIAAAHPRGPTRKSPTAGVDPRDM